ncbi:MAG TPA: ferredoxin [Acetobacteraceae bacterium]|jgi:hypothetical protein|nr:ferredoxin [Acetobacteraceae bacterium]
MTYVILSSKMGFYHTDISDDVRPCETYDYVFCGQKKAKFVIARLLREGKLRVVDETPPVVTTEVPSKFLPRFQTIEAARQQLQDLVRFGSMDTVLEKQP